MLERVPTILDPQEILDKAFAKAAKIDIFDPVRYHRIRKTERARLTSAADTVTEQMQRYHDAFPNLDGLRDYNAEILDILVGLPRLKKALGSLKWASQTARQVRDENLKRIDHARSVDDFFLARKRAYGRIASVVEECGEALAILAEARAKGKLMPTVSPDYATVVIAGYPNVGKTSLLRAWTNSRAEVKSYAFTTKKAEVGHFEIESDQDVATRYQVVDTPGLLDRPDEDRNDIERQAIAAVRHAADAVLFLVDPSEMCGYDLAAQERLREQTEREMAGLPFLVAETKCDMVRTEADRMRFSTTTGEGVEELQQAVIGLLTFDEPDLEQDPLDRWRNVDADEDDDW